MRAESTKLLHIPLADIGGTHARFKTICGLWLQE
jgi:hypothetical protein